MEPTLASDRVQVGIVAIGRNEGERLRRCLQSLSDLAVPIVYVDSGSQDASVELARTAGAHVVELEPFPPFTAARARNAGFARLMAEHPRTGFVQFLDGDCVLDAGWLRTSLEVFRINPAVAVVCGRRRERCPEASVYNRLCDMEWDTPIGAARACGGDALMRTAAFQRVGGYDPAMIAGEEPDLCLRLSREGFGVLRIDAEMTLHDAAMTRWTQWWQRAIRTGHTTAELLARYGPAPEHRRLRRALSAIFWAVLLPASWIALLVIGVARNEIVFTTMAWAMPVLGYGSLLDRIYRRCRRSGRSSRDARAYAISCVLAKWPETWGMCLFAARRITGRTAHWIEYKDGPRTLESARPASAPPSTSSAGSGTPASSASATESALSEPS